MHVVKIEKNGSIDYVPYLLSPRELDIAQHLLARLDSDAKVTAYDARSLVTAHEESQSEIQKAMRSAKEELAAGDVDGDPA